MASVRLVEQIGQGSYSSVYKAVSLDGLKTYAVKVIPFDKAPRRFVASREIKVLRECRHPNIAQLLDFWVQGQSFWLLFNYWEMNLSQYYRYYRKIHQRGLEQNTIRRIMTQICLALEYLHSKGIMHRDIKPENVMIDPVSQRVSLIDFGFAKAVSEVNTGYMVTRWYRPLEVVLGLPYDQTIDVFAVGAIYLQLILGYEVFQSTSNTDQLFLLLSICGYPSPQCRSNTALQQLGVQDNYQTPRLKSLTKNLPDSTRSVLAATLSNSPESRPSVQTLLEHFAHSVTLMQPVDRRSGREGRRKRACSAASGLTVVSLSGRSVSGGRGVGVGVAWQSIKVGLRSIAE